MKLLLAIRTLLTPEKFSESIPICLNELPLTVMSLVFENPAPVLRLVKSVLMTEMSSESTARIPQPLPWPPFELPCMRAFSISMPREFSMNSARDVPPVSWNVTFSKVRFWTPFREMPCRTAPEPVTVTSLE